MLLRIHRFQIPFALGSSVHCTDLAIQHFLLTGPSAERSCVHRDAVEMQASFSSSSLFTRRIAFGEDDINVQRALRGRALDSGTSPRRALADAGDESAGPKRGSRQKETRAPKRHWRDWFGPVVPVINPKVLLLMSLVGLAKFAWLVAFSASARS
jgi:hypothetical protein